MNDADLCLDQANKELEAENLSVTLKNSEELLTQSWTVNEAMEEICTLLPHMEEFMDAGVSEEVRRRLQTTRERSSEVMGLLTHQQESLTRLLYVTLIYTLLYYNFSFM